MYDYISDLLVFLPAVLFTWANLITGGVIMAGIWLWEAIKGGLSKKIKIALAGVFLFFAFYGAWREQYKANLSNAAFLQPTRTAPLYDVGFLPVGVAAGQRIEWVNKGKGPAKDAYMFCRLYFRSSNSQEEQKRMISDFESEWARKSVYARTNAEGHMIFPNDQVHCEARGPITTQKLLDRVFVDKTDTVFVVGVIQFKDSTGLHESHACQWLYRSEYTTPQVGGSYTGGRVNSATWMDCSEYVNQIDIRR